MYQNTTTTANWMNGVCSLTWSNCKIYEFTWTATICFQLIIIIEGIAVFVHILLLLATNSISPFINIIYDLILCVIERSFQMKCSNFSELKNCTFESFLEFYVWRRRKGSREYRLFTLFLFSLFYQSISADFTVRL